MQETPAQTHLERAKRLARKSANGLQNSARKSASELHKSVTQFQKEVRRRKLGWIWPTLAALLLALLIGSQWRHTAYWQRQLNLRMCVQSSA